MNGKLLRAVAGAAGGIALFAGSILCFSMLKKKPSEPPAEEAAPLEPESSDTQATAEPPAENGAPTAPAAAPASEVDFLLPSPFTVAQLNALLGDVERSREELLRRTAAVELREATLDRMRVDLDDRREELVKMREDVLSGERDLAEKRRLFDGEVVRLSRAEERNVKEVASVYEEMDPAAAAERLVALGVDQAAKVLIAVSAKKKAKIISAMPVDKASEVTARLAKILPDVEPSSPGK